MKVIYTSHTCTLVLVVLLMLMLPLYLGSSEQGFHEIMSEGLTSVDMACMEAWYNFDINL